MHVSAVAMLLVVFYGFTNITDNLLLLSLSLMMNDYTLVVDVTPVDQL